MAELANGDEVRINGVGVVPKIRLSIDENHVIDGAKEVLKVIRPSWNDGDCQFKVRTLH